MISLKVNTEIYSNKTIKAAKAAYNDLAHIDIDQNGDRYILTFQNCRYDEELTVKEFENYLIGLENS